MNEMMLVQFCIDTRLYSASLRVLKEHYGFIPVGDPETMYNSGKPLTMFYGKLESVAVTFLKLKHPSIGDTMRESYISDFMKDKYRK